MLRLRLLLLMPIAWLFVLTVPVHSEHGSHVNDRECADTSAHNFSNRASPVAIKSCSAYRGKLILAFASDGGCVSSRQSNEPAKRGMVFGSRGVAMMSFITVNDSLIRAPAGNGGFKLFFQTDGSKPLSHGPASCLLLYNFRNTQIPLRIYVV